MTKAEKGVIEKAIKEIQTRENDCFREIAFLNNHKYGMESAAMRYKAEAYSESWLIISSALDKITK